MKKLIIKFIIFCAIVSAISLSLIFAIDPFNVFHRKCVRDNGIEPNKNFIKMSYILENPNKFDSFIFGNSTVGAIHVEKINSAKFYNMTYSAGVPSEFLDNIRTFLKNGIIPKRIIVGVDPFSYTENPVTHINHHYRSPYEYSKTHPFNFWKKYFDLANTVKSLSITFDADKTENFSKIFYDFGWWCNYNAPLKINMEYLISALNDFDGIDATLNSLNEIAQICHENKIEFMLFTNPLYLITYEDSVKNHDYIRFLKGLSEINGFYNFSGTNNITMELTNYIDSFHYNAEIGDLIIDCIENGIVDETLYSQGFGWYVTKENIDDFLKLIEK